MNEIITPGLVDGVLEAAKEKRLEMEHAEAVERERIEREKKERERLERELAAAAAAEPGRIYSLIKQVNVGQVTIEYSTLALIKYPIITVPIIIMDEWTDYEVPIEWISGDIVYVMKNHINENSLGRMVVLPSQANAAEHKSHKNYSIPLVDVDEEDDMHWFKSYKTDPTGGPTGQLTGSRKVAEEVVRLSEANAENRRQGDFREPNLPINYFRDVFLKLDDDHKKMFKVTNGYFTCTTDLDSNGTNNLLNNLNQMTQLISYNNPAVGYGRSPRDPDPLDVNTPRLEVVYATAIPLPHNYYNYGNLDTNTGTQDQLNHQKHIALNIIYHQYRLALSEACYQANRKSENNEGKKYEVYLMLLGGGVFSNTPESITFAIHRAIDLVKDYQGYDKLKIRVLFRGNEFIEKGYNDIINTTTGKKVYSESASE